MNENSFAEKFARMRKEKMLSQKEMGEILGVSNKAVSKWETGESIPQMKTIIKISEYFKISPDELLTGTKYEKEKQSALKNDSGENEFLNALKNENLKLKTDLYGAKKKNKNVALISICVCVLCLMTVLLIVLSTFSGSKNNINESIKNLGKENTSIETLGEKFVPANVLEEKQFASRYSENNPKEATFVDENGDKSGVLIYAPESNRYIVVKSRSENYIYVNEKSRIIPNRKSVSCVELNRYDQYYGDYIDRSSIYSKEGLDYFFSHYNEDNIPEDSQEITKIYLYNNCYTIFFTFNDDNGEYVEAGKVFNDNRGNTYYYDYLTAQTYDMGGELFGYTTYN